MDYRLLYTLLGLLLIINFIYMLWANKNKILSAHVLVNLLLTILFMGLLPGLWAVAVGHHLTQDFQKTEFCTGQCHTMNYYGKSLTVPDDEPLASVHYRNNYVDQKQACYTCHTSYSAFGGVRSKFRGLQHVWVNYFGTIPDSLQLYSPYQNSDCLHCHGISERFQKNKKHVKKKDFLIRSRDESLSCLECHDVAHWVPSAEDEDNEDDFTDEDEFEEGEDSEHQAQEDKGEKSSRSGAFDKIPEGTGAEEED